MRKQLIRTEGVKRAAHSPCCIVIAKLRQLCTLSLLTSA
jgi:hypothetical protein